MIVIVSVLEVTPVVDAAIANRRCGRKLMSCCRGVSVKLRRFDVAVIAFNVADAAVVDVVVAAAAATRCGVEGATSNVAIEIHGVDGY